MHSVSVSRGIDTLYWLIGRIRRLAWLNILRFWIYWFFRGKITGVWNINLFAVNVLFNRWGRVFIILHRLRQTVLLLRLMWFFYIFRIYNIHLHIFKIQRNFFLSSLICLIKPFLIDKLLRTFWLHLKFIARLFINMRPVVIWTLSRLRMFVWLDFHFIFYLFSMWDFIRTL